MPLEMISLFCDVAEAGSVSRAAEARNITQSAVSQRMMALEKELGVRLIDRSHRPLQLTEAGQVYYNGCRKIVDQYEGLCAQLRRPGAALRGEVTIAAIYSAGIDLLNRVQSDFESAHPQTQVLIHYLQPDAVCRRVRDRLCDFGILAFAQRWRDLASIPLRDELMVVVCHPQHPLAGRESVHASDLDGQPLVMFDAHLPVRRRLVSYLKSHGAAAEVAASFDNIDTIKTYLAATRSAAAILPRRTVGREVAQGLLKQVALAPTFTRPLAVVHDRDRPLGPLARSFIETLKARSSDAEAEKPAAATTTA